MSKLCPKTKMHASYVGSLISIEQRKKMSKSYQKISPMALLKNNTDPDRKM